jgi:ketosteroid isomerase-like protein
MSARPSAWVVCAAALALGAPAFAREGACPRGQLSLLRRSFETAMASKQRERVLKLYSPDVVFLDEVSRRLQGRAELEGLYATVFAEYDSHLRLTPSTVARRRWATRLVCVEDGRFTEDLRDRSSGVVQHAHGPYRFAYARDADGRWRFVLMDWRPGRSR